jgi:hypothetical protein
MTADITVYKQYIAIQRGRVGRPAGSCDYLVSEVLLETVSRRCVQHVSVPSA